MKRSKLTFAIVATGVMTLAVAVGCDASGDDNDENENGNTSSESDPASDNIRGMEPCDVMDLDPAEEYLNVTGEYNVEPTSLKWEPTSIEAECWSHANLPEFEDPNGDTSDHMLAAIHIAAIPYDSEEEASDGFDDQWNQHFEPRESPDDYAEYEIDGPDSIEGDWQQGQIFSAIGPEGTLNEFVYALVQDGPFLVSVFIEYDNDPGERYVYNSIREQGDPADMRHYEYTLEELKNWVATEYITDVHESVSTVATS